MKKTRCTCEECQGEVSRAAALLGSRGRGKPKKLSPDERLRRSLKMREYNRQRELRKRGRK